MTLRYRLSLCLFLSLLLTLAGVVIYAQGTGQGTNYISGTWSDACPCEIPCPCWQKHEPSVQRCVNFHVFRIQNGSYHDVDLSGSVFVLLNLPTEPWHPPAPDTLFVDANDSKKAAAMANAFKILFSFAPPKVLRTPIEYAISGRKQRVSIPGLLSYAVSFEHEQTLSPATSQNLYSWLSNARQGSVDSVVYSPTAGEEVKYSNTNALFAEFRIRVPQQ